MRKLLLAFTLLIGVLVCGQIQAALILIDFDNLPGGGTIASGTNLTNQYSSLGVNFSALEDGSPALADAATLNSATRETQSTPTLNHL